MSDPEAAALYQAARTLAESNPGDAAQATIAARLAEQAGLRNDAIVYYARSVHLDPADADSRAAVARLCDPRELELLKLPPPPPSRSFYEEWGRGWAYPARIFTTITLGGSLVLTVLGLTTVLFPFILPVMLVGMAGYALLFCGEVVRAGRSGDPERLHWPGAEGDLMDATFWAGMLAVVVARGGAILAGVAFGIAGSTMYKTMVTFASQFNAPVEKRSWTDTLPTLPEAALFSLTLLPLLPLYLLAAIATDDSALQALNPVRQFRRFRRILAPYLLVTFSFCVSLALAALMGWSVWDAWRFSGPGRALLVTPVCTCVWMWLYLVNSITSACWRATTRDRSDSNDRPQAVGIAGPDAVRLA